METIQDVRSVFLYPRISKQRLSDSHLSDSKDQIGHSTKNRMGVFAVGDSCSLWDFLGRTRTKNSAIYHLFGDLPGLFTLRMAV